MIHKKAKTVGGIFAGYAVFWWLTVLQVNKSLNLNQYSLTQNSNYHNSRPSFDFLRLPAFRLQPRVRSTIPRIGQRHNVCSGSSLYI